MTSTQIVTLIKFLLDRNISVTKLSWSHTDNMLHLHFLDNGGNAFHQTFNSLGHAVDWDD